MLLRVENCIKGLPWAAFLVMWAVGAAPLAGAGESARTVDFNRDIRPILADRCFHCHGPDRATRKAGLRLDEEDAAKERVIVPGDADASELFRRIIAEDPLDKMPPPTDEKPALDEAEQALIRAWIDEGAEWAEHWAFAPPVKRPAPEAGEDWARNPIDRFVAEGIEAAGLATSPEADRATLLRRLSFDLTGLPPTPEELDAFVSDTDPDYYERAVRRLMASPAYGERMALDWLDGARYADTNGFQNDFARDMWLWRDWVIDAFNAHMPYDQFTVEQIAGDLLPDATDRQRIATGFNRNNMSVTEGGAIEEEWLVENLVDRVSTTGTVFLGLTMSCARCHDHKYDPVSQREFFEFYAFFNSTADRGFYEETRGNTGPVVHVPNKDQEARVASLREAISGAEGHLERTRAEVETPFEDWWHGRREAERPDTPAERFGLPLAGDLEVVREEGFALPALLRGNDAPEWQEGLFGPALYFDGREGQHVHLGDLAVIAHDEPFSMHLWTRPDGPGALASRMDTARDFRGFDLLVEEGGTLAVHLVRRWDQNGLKVRSREPLTMGQWAAVGLTWDGSGKAAGVQLYIGGYPVPMEVVKDDLSISIRTDEPLRLGMRSEGEQFAGALAGFRYFDTALAPEAMADLVAASLADLLAEPLPDSRVALLEGYYAVEQRAAVAGASLKVERAQAEKNEFMKEVPTVMVMEERETPRPTYLLQRGLYDMPDTSEELYPAVPAFLPSLPETLPPNRLALAKWLVDPDNPLTARVKVNRLWQQFFGEGLAPYADNFGIQSPSPDHLALLDWLAVTFVESGWDIQALQKLIVTSATYRQDSRITSEDWFADPENKRFARGPRYRFQAEMIRDNALATSGLLVDRVGGPSVMPYQPEGLWDELAGGAGQGPYEQATDEDLYRRSLYTYRKRTVPHPTTATFDAPSWELCSVYRSRTNTPLQALALLNDTTYVEAARKLGERMIFEGGELQGERAAHGFRLATGRQPNEREQAMLEQGLERFRDHFTANPEDAQAFLEEGEAPYPAEMDPVELAAYGTLGGVILNLDETISKE